VAKVESHAGENSFPHGLHLYDKRGTVGQGIKQGKYALKWRRLSCHGFRHKEVRLQLFALADSLANLVRRLALPDSVWH
jgi:hypothetical protein